MQTLVAMPPLVRTIAISSLGSTVRKLPDGSSMVLDQQGRIVQVEYSTGSVVSCHDDFCLVQTAGGDYWYCDKLSNWHCLD